MNQDRNAPIEIRYGRALRRLRNELKGLKIPARRKYEIEISYLQNEIKNYGFNFKPEFYLRDHVEALENLHVAVQPSDMKPWALKKLRAAEDMAHTTNQGI